MELIKIKKLLESGRSIFDLELRVVYYARVSTDKDEQLNSLSNQVGYFEEYIKKNPNWQYAGSYVDEGLSGTTVAKRVSFLRMIEDAKKGMFDLIVTKEISRFSRNTLDSIRYTQELLRHGVGVFFQSDNINTLYPDAELRLTIMSSIAQDEVRKLSERVRFGFKRAVDNSRVLGANNMLGYDKANGKLTVVEEEAEVVRKIFDMYIEGKCGIRRIARELEKQGVYDSRGKMLSFSSIKNILVNPKYKGYYCGGKYTTPDYRDKRKILMAKEEWVLYKDEGLIPPIVTEEVWDRANELLAARGENFKEHRDAYQSRYHYSGKLFCGEHGTTFHRHVYKSKRFGDREVWNCKMYRLKGKTEGCDSPTVYTDELNEIMTGVYRKVFADRDNVIAGLMEIYENVRGERDYQAEIRQVQGEIGKIRQKKDKILELNMEGLISKEEFASRNNAFNIELRIFEEKALSLSRQMDIDMSNKNTLGEIKRALCSEWSETDVYDSNISTVLLDKIIVHKGAASTNLNLEISLKLGMKFMAEIENLHRGNQSITLWDIGISQAQVSRLEKNAISQIRKYL